MANWVLYLVILGAAFQCSEAVDRGNFKTCDQNAFCKSVSSILFNNFIFSRTQVYFIT